MTRTSFSKCFEEIVSRKALNSGREAISGCTLRTRRFLHRDRSNRGNALATDRIRLVVNNPEYFIAWVRHLPSPG